MVLIEGSSIAMLQIYPVEKLQGTLKLQNMDAPAFCL
jgi:hypothetical protein